MEVFLRLAKLTLAGFKSFADKTEIDFDAPLVGVVGPNGCGKSNVVDAVKWVLGDQSPKSLRGSAMMDVIFNGSSARKPAGMASVTLTFDNPVEDPGEPASAGGQAPRNDTHTASDDDAELPTPDAANRPQRALPLDADQVAVTRNLFRDGTSEYLINGRRARLRDVRELFMDTGVGTDAYSVIEQGKVARMLDANPAERRQLFEEAAGVSRFKARKKEASRKLERSEQNLALCRQRLEDTEKRLRSVKLQAARARSYQQYQTRLQALQLQHALADFHRLTQRMDACRERLDQAEADRAHAARELSYQEDRIGDAEIERQAAAEKHKQLETQRHAAQSERDQARQRVTYSQSSLDEARDRLTHDQQRQRELQQQLERFDREKAEHRDAAAERRAEAQRAKQRLEDAQAEHQRLQQQLNTRRRDLETAKSEVVSVLRSASNLRNEASSLQRVAQTLDANRDKLEKQHAALAEQAEQAGEQRETLRLRVDSLRSDTAKSQRRLEAQQQRAGEYDRRVDEASAHLTSLKDQRTSLDSRRKALQEMQDRHEGVTDAVKQLLEQQGNNHAAAEERLPGDDEAAGTHATNTQAAKGTHQAAAEERSDEAAGTHAADTSAPNLPPIHGLLGELIETSVEDAPLVEAALGEYQQALVIDRTADLTRLGPEDHDALPGRITFLPIDHPHATALPPHTAMEELHPGGDEAAGIHATNTQAAKGTHQAAAEERSDEAAGTRTQGTHHAGAIASPPTLADCVACSDRIRPLVDRILGRTVVVADLDRAVLQRASLPSGGSLRFITRAGQLLESDGRIVAGPVKAQAGAGLIQRRSELTELTHKLQAVEGEVDRAQQDLESLSSRAADAERRVSEMRQSLYDLRASEVEAAGKLEQTVSRVEQLEKDRPIVEQELEQLREQLRQNADRRGEATAEADRLEADAERRQAELDAERADIDKQSEQAEAAHESVAAARVEVGKLDEQARAAEREARQAEVAHAEAQRQLAAVTQQLEQRHERTQQLEKDIAAARDQAETAAKRLDELTTHVELAQRKVEAADKKLAELKQALRTHRQSVEKADAALHDLRVEAKEIEVKLDTVRQRAAEQLDIDIAERYEQHRRGATAPSDDGEPASGGQRASEPDAEHKLRSHRGRIQPGTRPTTMTPSTSTGRPSKLRSRSCAARSPGSATSTSMPSTSRSSSNRPRRTRPAGPGHRRGPPAARAPHRADRQRLPRRFETHLRTDQGALRRAAGPVPQALRRRPGRAHAHPRRERPTSTCSSPASRSWPSPPARSPAP